MKEENQSILVVIFYRLLLTNALLLLVIKFFENFKHFLGEISRGGGVVRRDPDIDDTVYRSNIGPQKHYYF